MTVLSHGNGVKSSQSYARVIICNYVSTRVFVTKCSQVLIVISEEIAVPITKGCLDVGLIEEGLRC
jgi:small ligand-binding sensory domain FIST